MLAEYTLTPEELGEAVADWLQNQKAVVPGSITRFEWVSEVEGPAYGQRVHWDSYRAVVHCDDC